MLVLVADLEQKLQEMMVVFRIRRLGISLAWLCMDTGRLGICIKREKSSVVVVSHDIQGQERRPLRFVEGIRLGMATEKEAK
jgi:hypothetical protein